MKLDHKKELKGLYTASASKVELVTVPAMRFLMVDGQGDPGTSPEYAQAIEALFAASYTAKFMIKKGPTAVDYAVMPLEGLWWADDMSVYATGDRAAWRWTMMIMQPAVATDEVLYRAIAQAKADKGLPGLDRLRLETFDEGVCAQLMHVGPFTEEGPTLERLHAYVEANGRLRGKHHEIYLSDVRRAAPDKWKTILRQPMVCR